MLQIEYPNGLLLDVGWFPSFNLKGCFLIQVIENFDWENPIIKRECNELEIFKQLLQETILFCNEKVS